MIYIDHSSLSLFGREVELYGLVAVVGAVVITLVNTWLAHRRGLDDSFAFRLSLLVAFSITAFHVFFQNVMPQSAMLLFYAGGFAATVIVFWLGSRICGHDGKAFTQLGLLTVFGYSVAVKISCMLAGCCYGPPWQGAVALVYGADTHNPLPGVGLFPLQPVQVMAFLGILIFGGWVFLKKRPSVLLMAAGALNLAVYYTGILISPDSGGDPAVLTGVVSVLFATALGLFAYVIVKRKKGAYTI